MTSKRHSRQIDRDKLRAAVRKLGNEYVCYMLDDAVELLAPAMVSRHYSYGRDKMLAIARRTATPGQRKALAEVKGA